MLSASCISSSVLPAGFCPAGSFSLFERGFCCKHPHLRHTPPDHTCRHSLPGDCLTPFFSRFRGRFLLRLSFFISFLHNESGDARSSVSPDWCYLLLHGNMLARSALFQVEKRCAAYSCRRKPAILYPSLVLFFSSVTVYSPTRSFSMKISPLESVVNVIS